MLRVKTCRKCGEDKDLSEFYRQKQYKDGHTTMCKQCRNREIQAYRAENPEAYRKTQRKVRHRGRYGLLPGEWECLLKSQNHRCALCREEFACGDTPHVDHDHDTGQVRGLLHGACNKAIGLLRDSPDKAILAAEYLKSGGSTVAATLYAWRSANHPPESPHQAAIAL